MSCDCLKPRYGCRKPTVHIPVCNNRGRDVEFIELAEFLPRVTLVAKGVPEDVALEYLRQSAQTLARESWLCFRKVTLDVQAGVPDYYLEDGDSEQVHYVHSINLCRKGRRHHHCETSPFIPLKGYRDERFEFHPPDKIELVKVPMEDREAAITVEYLAIPTQNACRVDKLLYDRYQDVVVNGALAQILLMRQYSFADPQMAMMYDRQFKQGINKAKIDVMRQFETGTQRFHRGGLI